MINFMKNMKLIDLSVTVSESLPSYWPTHMPFSTKVWNYYAEFEERQGNLRSEAPYQTRFWIIDEHCGTHFDAPTHFIPPVDSGLPWADDLGSQTGEKVPLEDLTGPGVCIDVTSLLEENTKPGESAWITPTHINQWESEYGLIQPGEVVLFRTGWDRYYVKGEEGRNYSQGPLIYRSTKGWPAPNVETILILHERGVRCLGIDAPSIGATHDGAPTHQEGLSRGMRYVEMLTKLSVIPPRGFWFMFLPVKVAGSTGGPGRAIALIEDK